MFVKKSFFFSMDSKKYLKSRNFQVIFIFKDNFKETLAGLSWAQGHGLVTPSLQMMEMEGGVDYSFYKLYFENY